MASRFIKDINLRGICCLWHEQLHLCVTSDNMHILVGQNSGFKPNKQVITKHVTASYMQHHMQKLFIEQYLSSIYRIRCACRFN
jgi:hypothetical protein